MSALRGAALDAARRGYRVFPLVADTKHGRRGWQVDATTDHRQIGAEWAGGVGIALGAGQYVLDADTPEAVPVVAAFETLRIRTPRGMHAYFTLPAGVHLAQGRRIAEGIDGKGLSAIGTPTVIVWQTADGAREIVHDGPAIELPGEWIQRIGPVGERQDGPRGALTGAELARCGLVPGARERGYSSRAEQGFREAARRLAVRLTLGGGSWGDAFYAECASYGHFIADGEVTLDEADLSFRLLFEDRDAEGGDPTNVLNSIRNGLVAGAREALPLCP